MSSLWSIRAAALATAVTVVLTSRSVAQDAPASRLRAAMQAAITQNPDARASHRTGCRSSPTIRSRGFPQWEMGSKTSTLPG